MSKEKRLLERLVDTEVSVADLLAVLRQIENPESVSVRFMNGEELDGTYSYRITKLEMSENDVLRMQGVELNTYKRRSWERHRVPVHSKGSDGRDIPWDFASTKLMSVERNFNDDAWSMMSLEDKFALVNKNVLKYEVNESHFTKDELEVMDMCDQIKFTLHTSYRSRKLSANTDADWKSKTLKNKFIDVSGGEGIGECRMNDFTLEERKVMDSMDREEFTFVVFGGDSECGEDCDEG